MKIEVHISGVLRTVEIHREASGRLRVAIEGSATPVDAMEISPGAYSILLDGLAFEAQVLPPLSAGAQELQIRCAGKTFAAAVRDPRSWRGRSAGEGDAAASGSAARQVVTSPMPGKVVRVLVAAGADVELKQGLVVVEAMKMQNEIRAPRSGRIERIFVKDGQTVAAGEPLVSLA